MADPHDLPDMVERLARIRARQASAGGGDGTNGSGRGLDHRVTAIERTLEKLTAKLDQVLEAIGDLKIGSTRIEERLDAKASSSDLADIKGRIASLPTTWQMITLVIGIVGGILGGAFLILRFGLPHP